MLLYSLIELLYNTGMAKLVLKKPLFIMVYGFPGAGKTYFARKLTDTIQAAHVSSDRIRGELFEKPRYDKPEDAIVEHLVEYMCEEFLNAGVSAVLDMNTTKTTQRRQLRDLARAKKAKTLLVWLQIDTESAFSRIAGRDKRKNDDKFSRPYDRTTFDAYVGSMQHPTPQEDYVVLSGKHSWPMQRSAMLRKLFDMNLLSAEDVSKHVVKPGLINLVPSGRVDMQRRNINIR